MLQEIIETIGNYVYEIIIGVIAFITGKFTRKDKDKAKTRKQAKTRKKGKRMLEKANKLIAKAENLKRETEK